MAITYTETASATGTGVATIASGSFGTGSGVSVGDVLVVVAGRWAENTGAVVGPTGFSWNFLGGWSGSTDHMLGYKYITSAENKPYSITATGQDLAIKIARFSVASGLTEPIHAMGSNNGADNNPVVPPLRIYRSGTMAVSVLTADAGVAVSGLPSGYTAAGSAVTNNDTYHIAYQSLATSLPNGQTDSWTLASSQEYGCGLLILQDADGDILGGPSISSAGDFDVLYDDEKRVVLSVADASASGNTVYLNDTAVATGGVSQTITAESATEITLTQIDLGTFPDGALSLVLEDAASGVGSRSVTVNAAPAGGPTIRTGLPNQTELDLGDSISLNTDLYFYDHLDSKSQLDFTLVTGSLPGGLSLSTSGLITGTIASGAATGSPYTATIRRTDKDSATLDTTLTWTVAT